MLNLFDNLDNPERLKDLKDGLSSVEDISILHDALKILSQKMSEHTINSEIANELITTINARQLELRENLRFKRSNGSKKMLLSQTSVSNRVGTASIVFLVTNIVITAAMYALLVISHFLNN